MKIIYIVGFDVSGNSGKSKATREKARVLKDTLGDENFSFYSPKKKRTLIAKVLNLLFYDFKVGLKLLVEKNVTAVIQRVSFLPFTMLVQYLKSITVICEFHADFTDEIPHLNKSTLEKKILKLLAPLINMNFRFCNGIIYNHPVLKEIFDSKYTKPSIYSYNGSNYIEFYPENKSYVREKLLLDKEKVILLFLGSVSKWHGVDYLIDIFNDRRILELSNVFLFIVGSDENEYTNTLKSNCKNKNVSFTKPVNTDSARDFINASDFCLLPVKQIRMSPGSPLKLYDYIACGKPIITQSNLLGYSDEVENYELGYTIDFANASICAEDILKILNNKVDFADNNRRRAVDDLSWEIRISKWLDFVKRLSLN